MIWVRALTSATLLVVAVILALYAFYALLTGFGGAAVFAGVFAAACFAGRSMLDP